jgi:hypothetical protein
MDTNVKFQQQKAIIDELKKASLITDEEWYRCLTKLLMINNEKSNK